MARGVIALAVAVVVAALVAGAAAQPSQAQYDEFMAGSVGGSVVGMVSATNASPPQHTAPLMSLLSCPPAPPPHTEHHTL